MSMIATIKLYEPNHDHLKVKTNHRGLRKFVWVIEYGAFVFIKPSEESASRFLAKKGFVLSNDYTHWVHKFQSDDQENLQRLYTKV